MFSRSLVVAVALSLAPVGAFAAGGGGGDGDTPTPTKTTKECTGGKIWSDQKNACVDPGSGSLNDDIRYGAVREYAYAGDFAAAQTILATMADQSDDRVLTYWGFTHRKMGQVELGMSYYQRALEINPDNLLVRSYMGQAFVEAGETYLAYEQLQEIRARGGDGSWPATSLAEAIRTGVTYNY